MKNLRSKSIHAVKWNSINQVLTLLFRFAISVVMARLLSPRDFGLMAMILVITDLSHIFINSGFNSALVQKKTLKQEDYSTVFYIDIGLGFFFTLLLWFAGSILGKFYGEPKLEALTQAVSLVYFVSSFSLVQRAILTRELAFKKLTNVDLGGTIFSGVIGISFALYGFGVWSLVWSHVLGQLVIVILFWILSPWRPGLVFKWSTIKNLWYYSFNILMHNLLHTFSEKFDIMLVGRLFPVGLLGFYSKARSTTGLTINFIAEISARSFFPILSKLQDDKNQFKYAYLKLLNFVVFISLPLFVFLILSARELVGLVFGHKWLGMVFYFQLFCLAGGINVMNILKIRSITALGRPDLNLKLQWFVSPLRLSILLAVALTFSSIDPAIYIWLYFFFHLLMYICLTGFLKKLICLDFLDEFRLIYKELFVAAGIGLLCHGLLLAFPLNELAELGMKALLFFTLYFSLAYLLNFPSLRFLIDILKRTYLNYSNKGSWYKNSTQKI